MKATDKIRVIEPVTERAWHEVAGAEAGETHRKRLATDRSQVEDVYLAEAQRALPLA